MVLAVSVFIKKCSRVGYCCRQDSFNFKVLTWLCVCAHESERLLVSLFPLLCRVLEFWPVGNVLISQLNPI